MGRSLLCLVRSVCQGPRCFRVLPFPAVESACIGIKMQMGEWLGVTDCYLYETEVSRFLDFSWEVVDFDLPAEIDVEAFGDFLDRCW